MPYALNNTAEILSANIQRNPNKQKKLIEDSSIPVYSSNMINEPLFDVDDVNLALEYVEGIDFNKTIKINDHIYANFIPNGHLLGAASILVTIKYSGEKPIYLFFSGDYSKSNIFFDVDEIHDEIKKLPLSVIEEATYGTSSKEEIKYEFKENLLNSIKNRETFIVPVFSLGRSQEMLLELKRLQESNLLSESVPIFLDGKLAQSYTNFYLTHKEYLKKDKDIQHFLPKNLTMVTEYDQRQALLVDRSCKIILTTSGMGSYGPAQLYLPYYISQPKCTIHFCGYTTPNTFGSKIKEVEQGELFDLNGILTKKKAKVFSTNEYSGHAKKEDLLDSLKKFENLKSVLVNHGNEDTKLQFAKYVSTTIAPPKGVAILNPNNYIRVGAYGIIKSYAVNYVNFNITN